MYVGDDDVVGVEEVGGYEVFVDVCGCVIIRDVK